MRRQRIFISYRRSDSAGHAGRLEEDLTHLLGSRVFMDVADINPGEDFVRAIDRELRSCGAVLAVIGQHWREALEAARSTDYVRLELRQALDHDGVTVIPVLVQAAGLPSAADLPEDLKPLANRQAVAIRDDRWADDVAYLARALRSTLGLSRVPRWLVPTAAVVLAAIALGAWLVMPPKPAPFDRSHAHVVTIAAARKAAIACATKDKAEGECPVLFEFPPSGKARTVYFPVGYCGFKATPFGDCVLQKLESTRIPPFNNLLTAEVQLSIQMDSSGAVSVAVDE
jgi:TIR domain-containing protein